MSWKYTEKELLVKSICSFIVHRCKASVDQFAAGIKAIPGVFKKMQENPHAFALLFTWQDVDKFDANNLRQICKFAYSPVGSNYRSMEEETVLSWEEMLDSVGAGDGGFTASDLLMFITGLRQPPPAGFARNITIKFFTQESNQRRLPYASTCALELNIPRNIENVMEITNLVKDAISQGLGFGKI